MIINNLYLKDQNAAQIADIINFLPAKAKKKEPDFCGQRNVKYNVVYRKRMVISYRIRNIYFILIK